MTISWQKLWKLSFEHFRIVAWNEESKNDEDLGKLVFSRNTLNERLKHKLKLNTSY